MEYGVLVNNKFALFDDEGEDPLEVLQRTQDAALAAQKAAAAAKENPPTGKSKLATKNAKNAASKSTVKQPGKVLTAVQDQQKTKPTPPRRDNVPEKPPRFRQNENAQRRPARDDLQRTDVDFRTERIELRSEEPSNTGGRGAPQRRGRGGGAPRSTASDGGGFSRFGKREFDRHSGSDRTGLKPVDKREGGGAHNWGTIADAVAEQEQLAAKQSSGLEQTFDADTSTSAAPGDETERAEDAGPEAESDETKQLTLDEWKALQQRDRARPPSLNLRKPGEGCQTVPQWKNTYVLKKKVDSEDEEEDEDYDEEEDVPSGKQKPVVPIAIRFNDSNSRGGPAGRRGGRGGGGGGRRQDAVGGPGARSGPSARSAVVDTVPNVDNELDFPSLG